MGHQAGTRASDGRDIPRAEPILGTFAKGVSMCFAHSGALGAGPHVQAGVGAEAARAIRELAGTDGLGSVDVTGSGTPDRVAAPRGERVLDGFSRVLHRSVLSGRGDEVLEVAEANLRQLALE